MKSVPVCYAENSKGRCVIIKRGGAVYADWRDHTKIQERKSMTQEEMAKRLGVTPPAVNKWENGVSLR